MSARARMDYRMREILGFYADGNVFWQARSTETGEPLDTGACSSGHLCNWADREATPEEYARAPRWSTGLKPRYRPLPFP